MAHERIASYLLGKRRQAGVGWYLCDAVDERFGREVSLRVLTDTVDEAARAHFQREARALMSIEHPGVVMLYDYADPSTAVPYIAYERLSGPTLDTLLMMRGPLPEEACMALFVQVASALAALHEAGIVHGALTPGKVHVEADGRAVISDLSLAVGEGKTDGTLAARGTAIVTSPLFIPPELLDEATARSASADAYALGMMMTFAWLGGPPLSGAIEGLALAVRSRRFKRAAETRKDVARELTELADKVVHADPPSTRPSAAEVRDVLKARWQSANGGAPEVELRGWISPEARDPMAQISALLAQGEHDRALIAATGGRYSNLSLLGAGGMGRVTKAQDSRLSREVAIKTILDVEDEDAVLRFHREARALGRLSHPNIAKVIDYSGRGAPLPYIVLEYLDGATLAAILEIALLPEDVALALVYEICDALTVIHAAGLVHRDLKPENVFACGDGRIVVSDFGIVRGVKDPVAHATGTFVRSGTAAIGSPGFSSPEQIFEPETVVQASDMFSLGSVFHALITGSSPFSGMDVTATVMALRKVAYEPLEEVSNFSRELESRLLQREPQARLTAPAMLQLLGPELARRNITDRGRAIRGFLGEEREETRVFELATRVGRLRPPDRTVTAPTAMRERGRRPAPSAAGRAPRGRRKLLVAAGAVASAFVLASAVLVVARGRAQPGASRGASPPAAQNAPALPEPPVELPPPKLPPEVPPALPEAPKAPDSPRPREPDRPRDNDRARDNDRPRDNDKSALAGKPAELRVVTKPWARISIDGRVQGTTPFFQSMKLPPGRHTIHADNPGFRQYVKVVELRGGEVKEVVIELQP